MYVDDNGETFPPAYVSQIDPTVTPGSPGDWVIGNALGGKDPAPAFSGRSPPATNRLLNPYVQQAWEVFRCPADQGAEWSWAQYRPTVFDNLGNSYCFNFYLGDNYVGVAEAPQYNLALKKESWPPDPSRFIAMHEPAAFPWPSGSTVELIQWHGASNPGKNFNATTIRDARDKLVAPTLFVDGGSQQCDFTAIIKKNPLRGLEPGKDWMWYKPLK